MHVVHSKIWPTNIERWQLVHYNFGTLIETGFFQLYENFHEDFIAES